MANKATKIDEWDVRDLEDNSTYRVIVEECTELGNKNKPGIRITYTVGNTAYYCVHEPYSAEKHVYEAKKAKQDVYVLKDKSWTAHEDHYVRNSLVVGDGLKARVEIKVRSSSQPKVKEYPLPFTIKLDG